MPLGCLEGDDDNKPNFKGKNNLTVLIEIDGV